MIETPRVRKQKIARDDIVFIYERNPKKFINYPYHYHDLYQLLFVVKGKGTLTLNDKQYPIEENTLLIINKGDNHKIVDDSHNLMTIYIINYNEKLFSLEKSNTLLEFLQSLNDKQKILSTNNIHLVTLPLILKEMLFELSNNIEDFKLNLCFKLLSILILIKRYIRHFYSEKDNRNLKLSETDERVKNVINFLQLHYYENITLESAAKLAFLSRRQFTRILKKLTGMTLKKYITKLRLNKAKELLETTNKEIIYICYEVGFEDLSYFYKMFKEEFKSTPKKIREQMTESNIKNK